MTYGISVSLKYIGDTHRTTVYIKPFHDHCGYYTQDISLARRWRRRGDAVRWMNKHHGPFAPPAEIIEFNDAP